MNAQDLLDVIGDARENYVLEAKLMPQREMIRRPLLIAAVIILIIGLVGCAAAVIMNLNSLVVEEQHIIRQPDTTETEAATLISLQGFVGSSNYQAAKEWYDFEQAYDPDGTILSSIDEENSGISPEYAVYGCYTQEMKSKVDEICKKYDLKPLGQAFIEEDIGMLFDAIGIEGIVSGEAPADVELSPGYFYSDGSFQISGETKLTGEDRPWIYTIEYQFRCVMKSSFDAAFLNVGEIDSYDQWTYTMTDGAEVVLAVSPDQALIIADKEELFITVNVLNPRVGDIIYGEQAMDRAAMEAFADTFDFSFLPHQPDIEAAQQREDEIYAEYRERQEK